MALDKFNAVADQLDAAGDRLIAKAAGDAMEAAQAKSDLAAADEAAAAKIQPTLDKINGAAPVADVPPAAPEQPAA